MNQKNDNLTGGLVLILIGGAILLGRFVNLSSLSFLFLPLLGAAFLLSGIVSRQAKFIIPGGIISGIGWGSYLIAGPFESGVDGGAIFMLAFAAGWLSITLLTAIFTRETQWWALIPGGIMALIGVSILSGGIFNQILALVGDFWPVGLILLGIFTLLKGTLGRSTDKADEALNQFK